MQQVDTFALRAKPIVAIAVAKNSRYGFAGKQVQGFARLIDLVQVGAVMTIVGEQRVIKVGETDMFAITIERPGSAITFCYAGLTGKGVTMCEL